MQTMWKRRPLRAAAWVGSVILAACGSDGGSEDAGALENRAILGVKMHVTQELDKLATAAEDLQKAAPSPDADGWNPRNDEEAVRAMKKAWGEARDAYEHIEGAIAVLFPNLDESIDQRYDAFIELAPDDDLFDGDGVIGMHGIERILWADSHPASVITFEAGLAGYVAAGFPENKQQAAAFKNDLCQRLVDETAQMRDDFEPLALDSATAFRGVIGSLLEQQEKVAAAASAEDESRYAQRTLDDMRANLAGGLAIYDAFEAWVRDSVGDAVDAAIRAGFDRVQAAYDAAPGPAVPAVPEDFDPDAPSAVDLSTPYGKLWTLLQEESDARAAESLVSQMLEAADGMGIPRLPQ